MLEIAGSTSCYLCAYAYGTVLKHGVGSQVDISFKTTDFPSLRSHQVSIGPQLGVELVTPHLSMYVWLDLVKVLCM